MVARKGGVFQFASLAGLAKGESKQKWIDSPPSKTFMDTGEYDYDAYFDIAHEPKPIWAAWCKYWLYFDLDPFSLLSVLRLQY